MKRIQKFAALFLTLTLAFSLSACGNSSQNASNNATEGNNSEVSSSDADTSESKTITYGKSQGPYTELFEAAIVPILEEQGYTLKPVDFSDLLTADIALNDGDVDVNVEQHTAYANNFKRQLQRRFDPYLSNSYGSGGYLLFYTYKPG